MNHFSTDTLYRYFYAVFTCFIADEFSTIEMLEYFLPFLVNIQSIRLA